MIASRRNDVQRVADQYRADGYDVTIWPKAAELPEFLRRFELDLVARKSNESVVVAVRERDDLAGDAELAYLASEVNSRPGWRFDMYITHENVWGEDVPKEATEPNAEQIRSLAEAAERLLSQQETKAALLLACSAAEAALRELAGRLSLELEWKTPQFVLNALYIEGVLSQDDYDGLRAALRVRNAIAHGLNDTGLTAATPRFLIDTARRMLELELSARTV